MPAQSLENITLEQILNAARKAEETPLLRPDDVASSQQVNAAISEIEQALSDASRNTTLKELV
jgi:hypothetical protein